MIFLIVISDFYSEFILIVSRVFMVKIVTDYSGKMIFCLNRGIAFFEVSNFLDFLWHGN